MIDVSGDGKTIVKASYGPYRLRPATSGRAANPNAAEWWRRYAWRDANGNGAWEPGEEGRTARQPGRSQAIESVDPHVHAPRIDEATASSSASCPRPLACGRGVVWRRDAGHYARQNLARPFAAFSEPVVIPDPGPDGLAGTRDDGAGLRRRTTSRLDTDAVVSPPATSSATWDGSAQPRPDAGRSPRSAGRGRAGRCRRRLATRGASSTRTRTAARWSRQNEFVLTPNDLINTVEGGRHRMRTWTAAGWGTFLERRGGSRSPRCSATSPASRSAERSPRP